jgi:hypothetical protein
MSEFAMRPLVFAALLTGMTLMTLGCAQSRSTEASASAVNVEQNDATPSVDRAQEAAQMVVAVEMEPRRMVEILEAHGMKQQTFEDLLFNIAQDPELTEAYETARVAALP